MTIEARPGVVRRMREDDLPRVLAWRNEPEIRRYMYTQHEISLDEHRSWFERSSSNPARHLLIFELEATPTGFVSFFASASGRVAEWGFYLSPSAPRGAGTMLGHAALDHGFGALALHKVYGEALAFNEKSIAFHLKLGFSLEGLFKDHHFDGSEFQSIVRFGLLAAEWSSHRRSEDVGSA